MAMNKVISLLGKHTHTHTHTHTHNTHIQTYAHNKHIFILPLSLSFPFPPIVFLFFIPFFLAFSPCFVNVCLPFLYFTFTHIYTQKENTEKNKLYPVITYLLYTQTHAYPCMHMHIYTDISFSGFGFGGMVEWWNGRVWGATKCTRSY